MDNTTQPLGRKLRLRGVERVTGLRRSAIYARIADPASGFPKPLRLSDRCVVWDENELRAWLEMLPRGTRAQVERAPSAAPR